MPRRILQGKVISSKSLKTLIVKVERLFKHPIYGKIVKVSKNYPTHDPESMYKKGDIVKIEECRPISKTKKWVVLKD